MAWYALYKWFIQFRKKPYTNWVDWYSDKLYDEWYKSLSDEQKHIIQENRRKRKEAEQRRHELAMQAAFNIANEINDKSHGALGYYMDHMLKI